MTAVLPDAATGTGMPYVPAHCDQAYHMFYLLMPSPAARQQLINGLKEQGILSVFHYLPLHTSPLGKKYCDRPTDCPVTETVSERLLRLPFYHDLGADDQQRIITAIQRILPA